MWSPDGRRLAFNSYRNGNSDIVIKNVNGIGEEIPVAQSPDREVVEDWSRDGRYIAYLRDVDGRGASLPSQDVFVAPLFGDRKPLRLTDTPFREQEPHFSFDGRWIAFASNEAGESFQVNVVPFPALDQRITVSARAGGSQPRWRQDGKELFYLASGGKLMSVDISYEGAMIRAGIPRELFDTGLTLNPSQDQYAVTANGQRFLVLKNIAGPSTEPLTVVMNWRLLLAH